MSADPAAQAIVRAYHRGHEAIGSRVPARLETHLLSARLALIGADEESHVGFFLGGSFVGTLPSAAVNALTPAIIDADGRDQRVIVSARIDVTGDVCRVSVALP